MTSRKLLTAVLGLAALIVIGVVGALALSDGSPAPLIPADPATIYDPVAAGEPLPARYRRCSTGIRSRRSTPPSSHRRTKPIGHPTCW
jgi:hypothetical protein